MKDKKEVMESLKNEILEKVREYYFLVHEEKQNAPFVPGKSRVNYAGRVFDEKEMLALADSSLEFWLTHGRYSRKFEKDCNHQLLRLPLWTQL